MPSLETVQGRRIFPPCTLTFGKWVLVDWSLRFLKSSWAKYIHRHFECLTEAGHSYATHKNHLHNPQCHVLTLVPAGTSAVTRQMSDQTFLWAEEMWVKSAASLEPPVNLIWSIVKKASLSGRSDPQHQLPEQEIFAPLRKGQGHWETTNNQNNNHTQFGSDPRSDTVFF